ncbi:MULTISPECIES: SDR family oxidoreductase [Bacillus]|uniref:SDR family oxidoreductase n=1 Tax=Bacillus TaxID=1386 RepID=UPI00374E1D19
MELTGKVAIVTGGSKGIGRQIAIQLAELGANVIINFSSNDVDAKAVEREIDSKGGNAHIIKSDISTVKGVEQLFSAVLDAVGRVDILVNNAGVMNLNPIENVTEEEFDRHFNINVKGTYFAMQQAKKHMEDGGRIINLSTSVNGQMFPNYSVYAGTKGAVEQFTRQLAKEFGSKGITVNAIAPGPVGTDLFLEGKTEEQIKMLGKMNAMNRLGTPSDIANAVELLVSEKSGWINGQTIRINGGFI